jgi:C4-dicarboxylate transporter DctM subunit
MGILFLILLFSGIPVSFATGISTAVYILLTPNLPIILLPQRIFVTIDTFSLLAIPLFMLAGELMNNGGITRRIVDFSSKVVGHIAGGLAHITILACMIFAGMCGSCTAAGVSIGSMMIPALKKDGYDGDFSAAVVASAAVLGPVIPPSIVMVVYASLTGTSVAELFLGGVAPGLLIGFLLLVVTYLIAKKRGYKPKYDKPASLRELAIALKDAIWALLLPVIIMGGILSGIFTATEAGVIGVVYALIVGFAYKEIHIRDIFRIFLNAVKSSANILFLMGTGQVLGWILTSRQIPQLMAQQLIGISSQPQILTLIMMGFILLLGCFLADATIVPILAPLLLPVIQKAGIDPIGFGVVLCITAVVGNLTPPVGGLLFVISAIGKVPLLKTAKAILPFLAAIICVIVLCGLFPQIVTFLPQHILK